MKVWAARSADKTRIRIQLEPFRRPWPGWEHRTGTWSQRDYRAMCASRDEVEIEKFHQDLWARLSPAPNNGGAA